MQKKIRKIRDWLLRYYLMLVIGLLIAVVLSNIVVTAKALWNNTLMYSRQLISEMSTCINTAMEKVHTLAGIINNVSEIQELFFDVPDVADAHLHAKTVLREQKLYSFLNSITFIERNMLTVTLLSEDGELYYSSNHDFDDEYIGLLRQQQMEIGAEFNSYQWTGIHQFSVTLTYPPYNAVSFQRYFIKNSSVKNVGNIFLTIHSRYFTSLLNNSKIGKDSSVYLVDETSRIIADN